MERPLDILNIVIINYFYLVCLQNWTVTELQKLCVMLRFVNMQLTFPLSKYNLVCICNVQQQQEVVRVLQSETFCKVEEAFYKNGSCRTWLVLCVHPIDGCLMNAVEQVICMTSSIETLFCKHNR